MSRIHTARPVAPEDITRGMHIAILHINMEYVPDVCMDELRPKAPPVFMLRLLPFGASEPLRVLEVCLPFVLVRRPDGCRCALDVRRYQFAHLPDRFARAAGARKRAKDNARKPKGKHKRH